MIALRSEAQVSYLTSHEVDDLAPGVLERIQVWCITPQLEEFIICVESPLEPEVIDIRPMVEALKHTPKHTLLAAVHYKV